VIEQADARLVEWAGKVVDSSAVVSLGRPGDANKGSGVSLFLMELVSQPPMRGDRRAPLQLGLRYLVTTWADDPGAEHRLLGELVAAAMQEDGFEVELTPLSADAWASLGGGQRPSFVIKVRVRVDLPEPPAKPVLKPMVVQEVGVAQLSGVVLGPGDVPLAAAHVDLLSLALTVETDAQGRFLFPAVPAEPKQLRVRIRARRKEVEVQVVRPDDDGPVMIRFSQLLEA
jgi:hypothetical protein